jgi:hypothetical protein
MGCSARPSRTDRLTHTALNRLTKTILEISSDVAEGWRAGSAVEVLVGAAHRQVDLPLVEPTRNHTNRVTKVPERDHIMIMGEGGDADDISKISGSIGYVTEQDQRGARTDHLGNLIGSDSARPRGL